MILKNHISFRSMIGSTMIIYNGFISITDKLILAEIKKYGNL